MATTKTGISVRGKKLVLILLIVVLCAAAVFVFLLSRMGDKRPGPVQPITANGDNTVEQRAAPIDTQKRITDKDYWWDVSGFSKEEKERWKDAGFTGKNGGGWAALFKNQGMTPEQAARARAAWMEKGFDFISAQEWTRAGFGPGEAYEWDQAVGDAAYSRELKVQGLSPENVRQEHER